MFARVGLFVAAILKGQGTQSQLQISLLAQFLRLDTFLNIVHFTEYTGCIFSWHEHLASEWWVCFVFDKCKRDCSGPTVMSALGTFCHGINTRMDKSESVVDNKQ